MERLIDTLSRSNTDAIIIPSEFNCYYFTEYHSDFCYIIATKDSINYYTDKRYYEEAVSKLNINVKLINSDNALDIIANDISKYKNIGIDETKVYYKDFINLTKAINKESFTNISDIIQDIRSIKNADEYLITETAVDIADKVFAEVLDKIYEGMTEKELSGLIDSQLILSGADCAAFDTIVAFGENSAHPHWHRSDRKLKYGDNILMDFGARYMGYNSDMTRVVAFGKPLDDFTKIYNIVLEANKRATEGIRAGMVADKADTFARDYIEDCGYGDKFTHSLGHGIGMDVHEYPRITKGSEAVLKSGMMFTIEPGIYIEGQFGVRIEDLVYLTESKVNKLTQSDKKLIVL